MSKKCHYFLLFIYMLLLVWIIVFKLQFSISELDKVRTINLIPFYYDNEISLKFHLTEILENVAIFAPLGIYLCMLKHEPKFFIKFIIILNTSLALEVIQYVLAVGCSDITDLLTNTCGGILGILIFHVFVKIFGNRKYAIKIITTIAFILTVLVTCGLTVLLIAN